MRLLKKLIPTHAKLQLYKAATVLSHLTYCSTIWHFCRASDKRKVERVKERALSSQQRRQSPTPEAGGGGHSREVWVELCRRGLHGPDPV